MEASHKTVVQALARQREPMCRECICRHVETRAKSAVRLKKLIEPGDKVLFALSGGELQASKPSANSKFWVCSGVASISVKHEKMWMGSKHC